MRLRTRNLSDTNMPMETLPTPESIEARAKAAGITMAAVCRAADMPYTTFWRWKNASVSPSLGVVQRLLDATKPRDAVE